MFSILEKSERGFQGKYFFPREFRGGKTPDARDGVRYNTFSGNTNAHDARDGVQYYAFSGNPVLHDAVACVALTCFQENVLYASA